jgi:tetratricopeptide (TPR) repeat protein
MILQIPDVFSGNLTRLHSLAHMAILQCRLAEALRHRYNHSYSSTDVDERIDLYRDALIFFDKHSEHLSPVPAMAALGASLYARYTFSAQQKDLHEGFKLLSSAVHTCPSEPQYLTDLGNLLMYLYMVSGSIDHLEESLLFLRRAHGFRIGHPARGEICRALAAATIIKDQHAGIQIDFRLEDLIEHYKEIMLSQPPGHHSHFEGWDGLCKVFCMQFSRTSQLHLLNRAVHCGQMACIMLNPCHPSAFRYSANLANALKNRFDVLGNNADYNLAMVYARRALDLGPPDQRSRLLIQLAIIMTSSAAYSGEIELLSEAICLAREALDCLPASLKFRGFMTLGDSLIVKASHFGDMDALEEGIVCMRQVLENVNEGTAYYFYGAVTASEALLQQHEMNPPQNLHALTEAIQLLEGLGRHEILEMYRDHVLYWTAKAYRAQFYHSGHSDILESAFAIDQQALNLRPPGHPLRCTSLAAVSEDIVELCNIKEHIDVEKAITMLDEALKDLEEGHPDIIKVTVALAKLLLIPDTPYTNFEKALHSLLHMLGNSPGSSYRCIVDLIPVLSSIENRLSSEWSEDNPSRTQCLDVYQALIHILPRLASLDMDLARRIQVLSQARDISTKASSHAIILRQSSRAIELLEAGRAVFWAQHCRLRGSFDSLDHDTAKELREINRLLEVTTSTDIALDLDSNLARARIERIMAERRRLSARFDEIVIQVRSQPGMDRFLRNLDYKTLSLAAIGGPVVVLQLSWMCVITAPHADPQIIPLHEITNGWIQGAANTLGLAVNRSRSRLDKRRARKQPPDQEATRSSEEYTVLAEIWRCIVQPILDILRWKVGH